MAIEQDAHAVLLPAFDGLTLSDATRRCLDRGGVSILLGESRAEYVARRMSDERKASESAEAFRRITVEARSRSGVLLVAVDQEPAGICRLDGLVPAFPGAETLCRMAAADMRALSRQVATAAASMGVNLFLAPIADALDGDNAWLRGRTLSADPHEIAPVVSAYVEGVQSGGVAATLKHFPGFRSMTGDPATDPAAICETPPDAIEAGLVPFRAAIAAGVELVMVGPAPVVALDPRKAALRSAIVVEKLTGELGFGGVVMADDLDGQATLRGDSVEQAAVDALRAGCDLLLLADIGDQLDRVAQTIADAARSGTINPEALKRSAQKVRDLARRYGPG